MLRWAEERARSLAREEGHHGTIDAWDIFEEGANRIALLRRRGFARRPEVYYLAALPGRAAARPGAARGVRGPWLAGEDDAAERAAHQPELTHERYRAFMQAPVYEQDLVAVAPEARFGAYCICWMDPTNGVGEFEPVGTLPELRRRGLARAVVLEGFRRMKARGAHTTLVRFEGENAPAQRSYELVGCDVRSTIYTYTKDT